MAGTSEVCAQAEHQKVGGPFCLSLWPLILFVLPAVIARPGSVTHLQEQCTYDEICSANPNTDRIRSEESRRKNKTKTLKAEQHGGDLEPKVLAHHNSPVWFTSLKKGQR